MLLLWLVVVLMIAVFAPALLHKVRAAPRFQASLAAYRVVPEGFVRPAWAMLVLAETAVFVLLVIDPVRGLSLCAGLLVMYAAAIAINIVRGRTWIDCGCGDAPAHLSWGLVLRNGVLAAIALLVAFRGDTDFGAVGVVAGLALGGVAGILYFGIDVLLTNRATHRRLWLEQV